MTDEHSIRKQRLEDEMISRAEDRIPRFASRAEYQAWLKTRWTPLDREKIRSKKKLAELGTLTGAGKWR